MIDSTSESGGSLDTVKGEIEVSDVVFKYPSRPNQTVLDGYSLKVRSGCICGCVCFASGVSFA